MFLAYVVCFLLGWKVSKPLLSRIEFDEQRDEALEIGSIVSVGTLSLLMLTQKTGWLRIVGCWTAFLLPAALAQLLDNNVDQDLEDEDE